MLKNELRIGNLVLVQDKVITVECIDEIGINFEVDYGVYGSTNYVAKFKDYLNKNIVKPVPITEKRLIEFGIKSCMDDPDKNGFLEPNGEYVIDRCGDNVLISVLFGFDNNYPMFLLICDTAFYHIKYIHQLQNLKFALTGKELIKNENQPRT